MYLFRLCFFIIFNENKNNLQMNLLPVISMVLHVWLLVEPDAIADSNPSPDATISGLNLLLMVIFRQNIEIDDK